jgi:hypothetical protein
METRMTIKFSDITGGGIPYGDNAGRPANPGIGKLYSNGELQRIELYTGAQYGWQNIVAETPGVTGYTGNVLETNSTNTITITGTNFSSGALATLIGIDGTEYVATSTSVNNLTNITAVFGSIPANKEPYDIRVTNPSNLYGVYYDILTVNDSPIWNTSAGLLGTFNEGDSVSLQLSVSDEENNLLTYTSSNKPSWISLNSSTGSLTGIAPTITSNTTYTFDVVVTDSQNESSSRQFSILVNNIVTWATPAGLLATLSYIQYRDPYSFQLSASAPGGTVSYSVISGSLPGGLTLSSSGLISGSITAPLLDTTYNFTVRATDGVSNLDRSFSYLIKAPVISTFSTVGSTSWIAPSGINTVELLVVAGGGGAGYDVGGGGGAGGLCYGSSYPVVPGTSYSITVGSGGVSGNNSGIKGSSGSNSSFGSVTAFGGGGGGSYSGNGAGISGGSGGGAGDANQPGGTSTQTSGANYTGYGNAGGASWAGNWGGGSGGGAGGPGNAGTGGPVLGGLPREYSISGSAVKYSGGGYGMNDGGPVYQTGYDINNNLIGYYGFGANGTGSPNINPNSGNPGVVIVKH